jgi:hypothetical protein
VEPFCPVRATSAAISLSHFGKLREGG